MNLIVVDGDDDDEGILIEMSSDLVDFRLQLLFFLSF